MKAAEFLQLEPGMSDQQVGVNVTWHFVTKWMEEYASQQSSSLVEENRKFREALKTTKSYLESFKSQWKEGEEILYAEIDRSLSPTTKEEKV